MKAILVAVVLAGCAFAFAIGTASADDGGAATATPSRSAPAQPVQQQEQQEQPRPRDDCPEKDGGGASSGSWVPSSSSELRPRAAGWRGIMGLTSCQ